MTSLAEQANDLTFAQLNRLRDLESVIEQGKQTFLQVGEALLAIREEKLYRPLTFEAYCEQRWGFSRAHGYRLINAANMSPRGDIPELPSEGHYRAIKTLPDDAKAKLAPVIADKTVREAEAIVRDYRERNGVGKTFNRHPRLVALAEELAGMDGRWSPDMCTELTPPQAQKQLRQIEKAIAILDQARNAVEYRAATPHSWLGR